MKAQEWKINCGLIFFGGGTICAITLLFGHMEKEMAVGMIGCVALAVFLFATSIREERKT